MNSELLFDYFTMVKSLQYVWPFNSLISICFSSKWYRDDDHDRDHDDLPAVKPDMQQEYREAADFIGNFSSFRDALQKNILQRNNEI